MPLKQLSLDEQIKILHDLDRQEKEYDKNLTLVKGDAYTLKHRHSVNVEPQPLEMIQEVYRQQPTIEAIKSVTKELKRKPQVANPLPKVTIPAVTQKAEPVDPVAPIPGPVPQVETEEETALRKHKIPTEREIDKNGLDIAAVILSISAYNKNILGSQLAQLTRRGMKDSPEYVAIQKDVQILKEHKNNLLKNYERQRVLVENLGTGIKVNLKPNPANYIKFGRYYANINDIKKGVLKIRKKNKAKVPGIPDLEITEGVKQLLLKRYDTKGPYTEKDYALYRRICDLTGFQPKSHSKLWEKVYVTNVFDAQKRLLNAIGELKAGNNNIEIRNEIVDLCDFLLKNNKLSQEEYKNLMSCING